MSNYKDCWTIEFQVIIDYEIYKIIIKWIINWCVHKVRQTTHVRWPYSNHTEFNKSARLVNSNQLISNCINFGFSSIYDLDSKFFLSRLQSCNDVWGESHLEKFHWFSSCSKAIFLNKNLSNKVKFCWILFY